MVFYSPSCRECIEAKQTIIPQIENEFKGRVGIEYRDITDIENYRLLLGLKEKYDNKIKIEVPVFFLEGNFLSRRKLDKNTLRAFMLQSLKRREEKPVSLPAIDLVNHFKAIGPLAITSAGLADGINPCAFTVIVFFVSFLTLQGYRKRELIIIGLSFIFAVFLTYLLLGLGLFVFLYRISGVQFAIKVFNICVGSLSIILGVFCVLDFIKFKKTRDTEGLLLQLPQAVKNRIHKVIGLEYRVDRPKKVSGRHILGLASGAVITGFSVSILEAICTGQMYLPTIAFVLKSSHLKLQAFAYLLLYNTMFILPLLAVFVFALAGATSEDFGRFIKRHMLLVKLLMAALFFGLGMFLLWRP
jgi:hypothetical protein